jgi:hypothetical protein
MRTLGDAYMETMFPGAFVLVLEAGIATEIERTNYVQADSDKNLSTSCY